MNRRRAFLLAALMLVAAVYFANASWLAPEPQGEARLMAHRGIHQLYDRVGIDKDTCTANRMLPPTNPYIENTLPSIAASFQAGADILEIDIHPTTDNEFVVFHDWTIDCRTEGSGVTREQSLEYLKSLDVGYGYTADGGKTFPFRGKGKGVMPSLAEVLKAFPEQRFLINFKSDGFGKRISCKLISSGMGSLSMPESWSMATTSLSDACKQLIPTALPSPKPR